MALIILKFVGFFYFNIIIFAIPNAIYIQLPLGLFIKLQMFTLPILYIAIQCSSKLERRKSLGIALCQARILEDFNSLWITTFIHVYHLYSSLFPSCTDSRRIRREKSAVVASRTHTMSRSPHSFVYQILLSFNQAIIDIVI